MAIVITVATLAARTLLFFVHMPSVRYVILTLYPPNAEFAVCFHTGMPLGSLKQRNSMLPLRFRLRGRYCWRGMNFIFDVLWWLDGQSLISKL
jgi:hypothetical protein